MKIICFETLKVDDEGKTTHICGAVQMTGFIPGKHTIRNETPCKGCGAVGNYDGVSDSWSAERDSGLVTINWDIEPKREL